MIEDGKPDKDLFELKKVDVVFRDGYMVVKDGRLNIERHPELSIPDKMDDLI